MTGGLYGVNETAKGRVEQLDTKFQQSVSGAIGLVKQVGYHYFEKTRPLTVVKEGPNSSNPSDSNIGDKKGFLNPHHI